MELTVGYFPHMGFPGTLVGRAQLLVEEGVVVNNLVSYCKKGIRCGNNQMRILRHQMA